MAVTGLDWSGTHTLSQRHRAISASSVTSLVHSSHTGARCNGRHACMHRTRATQTDEDGHSEPDRDTKSRRDLMVASVNFAVLGSTASAPDVRTAINSILGAYGLPRLKDTPGFSMAFELQEGVHDRDYDDYDLGVAFEYPKAWVIRPNRERRGVFISDFNTADKATLEVFQQPPDVDLTTAVIAQHSNPAREIGGDARLLLPEKSRIKASDETIDGQTYRYLAYPSETVTRSGYQIQRKNFAVAAVRQGTIYTLNASSRSDQANREKLDKLKHIIETFRLRV